VVRCNQGEREDMSDTKMLIPNSFQVPNICVDDLLPYLKGTELKVLLFLIRKTFGWQKKEDRISLSQFAKGTGISRPYIVEALRQLHDCHLIFRKKTTKGDIYWLNLDWNFKENEEWFQQRRAAKWFQNETGFKMKPVSKGNQNWFQNETTTGFKMKPTETHYKKPTTKTHYSSDDAPTDEDQLSNQEGNATGERNGKKNKTDNTIDTIINYLNDQSKKDYKSQTKKTRVLIKARLKEGFTIDDFKTVIDKKCAEWLDDPKMDQYLRPETLFGTKFEGYLNQRILNGNGIQKSGDGYPGIKRSYTDGRDVPVITYAPDSSGG
jgi:phage replication O-like protein O